jgi:hypothetical protein
MNSFVSWKNKSNDVRPGYAAEMFITVPYPRSK